MSLAWQQDWERWESDRFKQAFVVECFTKSHWGEEGGGASWPPSWKTLWKHLMRPRIWSLSLSCNTEYRTNSMMDFVYVLMIYSVLWQHVIQVIYELQPLTGKWADCQCLCKIFKDKVKLFTKIKSCHSAVLNMWNSNTLYTSICFGYNLS